MVCNQNIVKRELYTETVRDAVYLVFGQLPILRRFVAVMPLSYKIDNTIFQLPLPIRFSVR